MTAPRHKKLSFRRCWINKTNDFKSNFEDYSILNIEDCPLVQSANGIISGTYDVAGITRVAATGHPFSDGQTASIVTSGGTYTGDWGVSNVVAGVSFDISIAYSTNESGTWAGSFDVSTASHQVKITMKDSTLKDTDFTQSYVSEISNITGCKVSKVVFGKSKVMDCEEITGSTYLSFTDDSVCENVTSINLSFNTGIDLTYRGGSINSSLDLRTCIDNRLSLIGTSVSGNIDLDSDANVGVQMLNTPISGRIIMTHAGAESASAIISKNSSVGDVEATGAGVIDFSNTKIGSMTGSDSAYVKLKNCEVETYLTMTTGTILEKANTYVRGLTLIDNGVQVAYGDAEKALKAVQIIMTGN